MSSLKNKDKIEDLKKILKNNLSYLHAGSVFPDWGYLCKNDGLAETAHWP